MKSGIEFSIRYVDNELLELEIRASNGAFAGYAELYENKDGIRDFIDSLRGFPSRSTDPSREFALGTFDPQFAGGGLKLRFYGVDRLGHIAVEVQIRTSDIVGRTIGSDSATFQVPTEPALLDRFIRELEKWGPNVGDVATLDAV